jgi:hypothetical protein
VIRLQGRLQGNRCSILGKVKTFFCIVYSGSRIPSTVSTGTVSLVVMRPDCEADHSPLSSTEIKNALNHTCSWCFIKYKDNFMCLL